MKVRAIAALLSVLCLAFSLLGIGALRASPFGLLELGALGRLGVPNSIDMARRGRFNGGRCGL